MPRASVSRSSIHRLQRQGRSTGGCGQCALEENHYLIAASAGAFWYGDAMHGPQVSIHGELPKVYLVSPDR